MGVGRVSSDAMTARQIRAVASFMGLDYLSELPNSVAEINGCLKAFRQPFMYGTNVKNINLSSAILLARAVGSAWG